MDDDDAAKVFVVSIQHDCGSIARLFTLLLPYFYFSDTAGLDVKYEPTKINFQKICKGYDNSETTVGKLSVGESRSTWSIFVKSIFGLSFFETYENRVRTKIDQVESDLPCLILVCRGLRPF